MNNNDMDNNNIVIPELTDNEKEEAKQNGFILVGKTGVGKTTLLNALFNKIVGKVEKSANSCTQISSVYYYKMKNGKSVCLIDTPGLSDSKKTEQENIDKMHLEGITSIISKEKVHIKGILFLVNFQCERFDADEQKALLEYNRIFPLKDFWKSLVVIYTHFFADADEDKTEEELKQERDVSNGELFSKLMEKVKKVSLPISYNDLQKKYFNSHSDPNNEKKKKRNNKNRQELEVIFNELCQNEPLFNRVEIKHIKNHKWKDEKDGKEYIGEVEIIGYFDFNNEPLKERLNIISKEEVVPNIINSPPSSNITVIDAKKNKNDEIVYNPQEGNKNNSTYVKHDMSTGGRTVVGGIGGALIGTGIGLLASGPVGWTLATGAAVGALFGWLKK